MAQKTTSIGIHSKMEIDFNPEFSKALELMENTRKNVFVTGRAGTGKSTLLAYFRDATKKKVVVVAPTGVAALNVGGQTIHSFFGFKPDITISKVKKKASEKSRKMFEELETLVIDEASMVRADLLDCVDRFLCLNGPVKETPFGGVQMVFIGDLYQLPPVVSSTERDVFKTYYASPYFFDAKSFKEIDVEFVELEKVYRQKDEQFILLLNSIRNNTATQKELDALNTRVNPSFEPKDNEFFITLTTTNDAANQNNEKKLANLKGRKYSYEAELSGKITPEYFPTSIDLTVKKGAQVMMLNNDASGRWLNGSVGEIIDVTDDDVDGDVLIVRLSEGEKVEVKPHKWEVYQFFFNSSTNSFDSRSIGSFMQYPLRLAWAVTIHKSQGKTFDNVIIDLNKGIFAHGQLYVALSRCRTLEGIVLRQPIQKKHAFMDWRVVKFVTSLHYKRSEQALPLARKIALIQKAIDDNKSLKIVYLKASDQKTERIIRPIKVGEIEYLGRKFVGLKTFCAMQQGERTFRVDRILSLETTEC